MRLPFVIRREPQNAIGDGSRFRAGDAKDANAAAPGRMLPEGLTYLDSWEVSDGAMDRCFQLMETSDPALFDVWFERWGDLVGFELYPVITSAEAAERHS